MVTHYPSSNSSTTSLSSPTATSFTPAYAASQAGSSTFSRGHAQCPTSSSRSWRDRDEQQHRSRSISSASGSSQATLVASYAPAPRSLAGFPTAPPSAYSFKPSGSHQRAPSVASTSAVRQSSRHRQRSSSRSRGGSELGTTPAVVSNDFPWFGQTGDVEIEINNSFGNLSKRYLLHRLILAQNSAWFESDLAKDSSTYDASAPTNLPGASTVALMNSGNQRSCYELAWPASGSCENPVPLLVKTPTRTLPTRGPPTGATRNKPPPPSTAFFRSLASARSTDPPPQPSTEEQDILVAYDNLFLIFYNYSPRLSTTNIANAYVESKILLSLASAYLALSVVGPRVDHHLLRFGARLWKQIAKYPPSYLKLGYLARSRAIFSEALVHVVGQWPLSQPQLRRGTVDDAVLDLVEDKVDELEETRMRVEMRLLRLSTTNARGERISPSNGYTDWLALSLFRQWVADNTAQAPSPRAGPETQDANTRKQSHFPPRLVKAYRAMGQGGEAYLAHEELKQFLKLGTSYNHETKRKFERRMNDIKSLARDIVKPLTCTSLELDISRSDGSGGGDSSTLTYLTCTRCDERDFAYIWKE